MPINPATCPVGRQYTFGPPFDLSDYVTLYAMVSPDLQRIEYSGTGSERPFVYIDVNNADLSNVFYHVKYRVPSFGDLGNNGTSTGFGSEIFGSPTGIAFSGITNKIFLNEISSVTVLGSFLPDAGEWDIDLTIDVSATETRIFGSITHPTEATINFDETIAETLSVDRSDPGVFGPFVHISEFYYHAPNHVNNPCKGPIPTSSIILPESTAKPSYVRMLRGGRTLAEAKYFHEIMKRKNS